MGQETFRPFPQHKQSIASVSDDEEGSIISYNNEDEIVESTLDGDGNTD